MLIYICSLKNLFTFGGWGFISEDFPGIPTNIGSLFKFTLKTSPLL